MRPPTPHKLALRNILLGLLQLDYYSIVFFLVKTCYQSKLKAVPLQAILYNVHLPSTPADNDHHSQT